MKKLKIQELQMLDAGKKHVEKIGGIACAAAITTAFIPALWGVTIIAGGYCLAAANYEYYHNGWE